MLVLFGVITHLQRIRGLLETVFKVSQIIFQKQLITVTY
jgi:hypothetical protein